MTMKKKLKDLVRGLGLVLAAVAMMAVAIGFIYLVTTVFHTNSK
jgi:hypothetical protein